jgi:hypothetical protein
VKKPHETPDPLWTHVLPANGWNPAFEAALDAIQTAASRRKLITYTDLVTDMGRSPLIGNPTYVPILGDPRHRNALSALLGAISSFTWMLYVPPVMLTALVVTEATRQPGAGFYQLARDLGATTASSKVEEETFWVSQVAIAFGTGGWPHLRPRT